jgi:hypothetical protein
MPHWYDPARINYLVESIDSVRRQAPDVACAVVTNEPELLTGRLQTTSLGDGGVDVRQVALADAPEHLLRLGGRVAVIPWDHRHHPYRLTWFHKRLFHALTIDHDAFSKGISHLVYLEDDLRLADHALDYWCALRPLLAPSGLLPGFARVEGDPTPRFLTDVTRAELADDLPGVEVALPAACAGGDGPGSHGPGARCVNLANPYQAMSVLDAELAEEHFRRSFFRSCQRSRLSTELGSYWKVRERAAAGAIFDGVPAGFLSRNVVPLVTTNGRVRPLDASLVEHLPATYFRDPASPFGTLALTDAFPAPSSP